MKWDSKRRVYVDDRGRVIPPREIHERIERYIDSQKSEVEHEAHSLLAGTIASATFFSWLRDKLTQVHGAAALVAYGGEEEMDATRWARVGEKIASEAAYAQAFKSEFIQSERIAQVLADDAAVALSQAGTPVTSAEVLQIIRTTYPATDVPRVLNLPNDAFGQRLESLIFGQTESRSAMYMDSIYGTYQNSVKAREGDAGITSGRRVCEEDKASCDGCVEAASEDYLPLDEILDIGAAECLSSCRCMIEFNYAGVEPIEIDREVYA